MTRKRRLRTLEPAGHTARLRVAPAVGDACFLHGLVDAARAPGPAARDATAA